MTSTPGGPSRAADRRRLQWPAGAIFRASLRVAARRGWRCSGFVQILQRTVLGIANGAGVLGSRFDLEPVHMVYNAAFLFLLAVVYAGCRRNQSETGGPSLAFGLLCLAVILQGYHTVEHLVKMWQYLQTGLNGTPGILGYWFPVVYLHFVYNTAIYAVTLAAFFLGGYRRVAFDGLASLRPRRWRISPRTAS